MTVFNTFLKIVNKYKGTIILYTVLLVAFAGINFQTSDNSTSFSESKPSVLIINNDENKGITKNLIKYIESNSEIKKIENSEESIRDALFYRDVNYIITIPSNYRQDFLSGLNPKIEVKGNGTYESSLTEMMLSRYIKVANIYKDTVDNEGSLLDKINSTLEKEATIEMTSKLDMSKLDKAALYYNFLNYSILAGSVYVICLILASFKEEKIRKRTIISSMDYKKHNRQLLISNGILSVALWFFYVILSLVLMGDIMFSANGILFMLNSFIFSICSLTMAFLIGTLINNKDAINGIVNVISLGSSFLCGAFVPAQFLPNSVLAIAHVLPSYWYINSNDIIKTLEGTNIDSLMPVIINMLVVLLFSLVFILITNVVSKRKG